MNNLRGNFQMVFDTVMTVGPWLASILVASTWLSLDELVFMQLGILDIVVFLALIVSRTSLLRAPEGWEEVESGLFSILKCVLAFILFMFWCIMVDISIKLQPDLALVVLAITGWSFILSAAASRVNWLNVLFLGLMSVLFIAVFVCSFIFYNEYMTRFVQMVEFQALIVSFTGLTISKIFIMIRYRQALWVK